MSELNLVAFKLKTGETCFAELVGVTKTNKIILNNILEVKFDGMQTVAIPFFPFTSQTEFPIHEDEMRFLTELDEEYYSFYCNVVIAVKRATIDLKTKTSNDSDKIYAEGASEIGYLKAKFKNWITDSDPSSHTNNGTIH